jgi:hypothetical protein
LKYSILVDTLPMAMAIVVPVCTVLALSCAQRVLLALTDAAAAAPFL